MHPPSPIEINMLQWATLPAAVLATAYLLVNMSSQRSKCMDLCEEKEYHGFRYTPAGRANPRAQCHDLTEQESAMGTRIPKGTQMF